MNNYYRYNIFLCINSQDRWPIFGFMVCLSRFFMTYKTERVSKRN